MNLFYQICRKKREKPVNRNTGKECFPKIREIGMMTPPVGVNLFVASGLSGLPMETVAKAIFPFVLILVFLPNRFRFRRVQPLAALGRLLFSSGHDIMDDMNQI